MICTPRKSRRRLQRLYYFRRSLEQGRLSEVDRCGGWIDRDGLTPPSPLLVVAVDEALQKWKDNKPEVIRDKPLPDLQQLNAAIPQNEWENGIDGKLRKPWARIVVVYLVDPQVGAIYTYTSPTIGARIAYDALKEGTVTMRALRGIRVMPVVNLSERPFKTNFGMRRRPHFDIVGWKTPGDDKAIPGQADHAAAFGPGVALLLRRLLHRTNKQSGPALPGQAEAAGESRQRNAHRHGRREAGDQSEILDDRSLVERAATRGGLVALRTLRSRRNDMRTVVWDLETRSAVSLRECGAYIYAIDPSTDVLCLAFCIDDGEVQLWLPPDPVPPVFLEIAANPTEWQLVAHNYDFERAVLENILIPRHGFQPIPLASQHCTQRLALANAYPAELDLLAQALGLPYRKDPAARKAMLAVSRPKAQRKRKATTIPTWDEDPAKLQLLYERCKLDVITTRAVWQSPKLKHSLRYRAPLSAPGRDHQRTRHPLRSRLRHRRQGSRHPRAHSDQSQAAGAHLRHHHFGGSDQAVPRRRQRPRPRHDHA